ncbi:MAG: lytic transglycosylase domain-containing protein [Sulfurimonas sp.]|uniref:lytic transglycosylase domain-containing protein n=1 Tax=Sulfurimonas sp. TaxID=2022749 RepID=UPI0025F33941|nr:lytic transglycosylase domain-containing protein [Sulfurimonas sp.]MCK9490452.1 lytic transglycosylase domain-containing protein [Sulfurimonas sp.]
MFKLFLLLFISASLSADITLQDIESKPASRMKNFMIWQFLKQDITPKEADLAYSLVEGNSYKIYREYIKKTDNKDIKKRISCQQEKNLLKIEDEECLNLAFSLYKTLPMTKEQREELALKIKEESKKNLLKIQSEPYTQEAYEKYDATTILTNFISTTKKHRRENLNIYLDEAFINSLEGSWKISQFVDIVLHDENLDKLKQSLLKLRGDTLDSKTNFHLALNHLLHQNKNEAISFFELSMKKAKHRIDVDKNYFWIYKVSKDSNYLNELLKSSDINIYTLYAHEMQNKEVDNYFSAVETNDLVSQRDLKDPFEWSTILQEIRESPQDKLYELSQEYMNQEMIPVQTMILERAYSYKMHGFVMPYSNYLRDVENDDKALIYAIMRQESNFIPSALSRSYALGLMQIMPFLTDDLSKRVKDPVGSYEDMFIPKNNINYALKHLAWMKKSLYHPLFMAYAYNGGMGFLRRHLEGGTFSNSEYEPYLSMELMANNESREYGKKVLANYVMYKKVLGEDVSIIHLFDRLKHPSETDRFREQG